MMIKSLTNFGHQNIGKSIKALKKNIGRNKYLKKNDGVEGEEDEEKRRSEKQKPRTVEIEGVTEPERGR